MSDPVEPGGTGSVYRTRLAPPTKPDRSLAVIVLLAVISLAGTWALLPSSEEKAAGLYEDARYEDAIAALVAVEDERFLNAYESYMLLKLYILTKQPDNAAMLLQHEPALQGETAWALRQISDLYRKVGNYAGEASTLRRLYDLGQTTPDFARLRILYRLAGDIANEASVLAQSIAGGDAKPTHIQRLAYLLTVPDLGNSSAVWTAPDGSFAAFAPVSRQIFASSDLGSASITLRE